MDYDPEKKADNFHSAYSRFSIDKIASYGESDRTRLLNDQGIIRDRLRVNAAIVNAQRILELHKKHDSFKSWLYSQHLQALEN